MRNLLKHILFNFFCLIIANHAFAKDTKKSTIKLGMSTALTGPMALVGHQLHLGSEVYFNKVNKFGGIKGAKIELLVADDGYDPKRAVQNTHHFIEKDNVLALFGALGTPTSYAIIPTLEKLRTPYLMPYSGAEFLHSDPTINVFNIRASYDDESKEHIKYLVKERGHSKIGFLIQADEYGFIVETALLSSLSYYNLKPVKVARYLRNTNDISTALAELKTSDVTAIVLVGAYNPLTTFINNAHEQGFTPTYTSISFSSSANLFSGLKYFTDLMVTEVLPDPKNCQTYWCKEFLQDMHNANIQNPNRVHFEGYMNAVVFTFAAQFCPTPLQRSCLMTQLDNVFLEKKALHELFIDKSDKIKHIIYRSFYTLK